METMKITHPDPSTSVAAARPQPRLRRVPAMLGAVVVAAASLTLALPAAATPNETGCPSSSQVLVVDDLSTLGYRVPALIDSEGNNNGLVCGKPLNQVVADKFCPPATCTVDIIYGFRDDDVSTK